MSTHPEPLPAVSPEQYAQVARSIEEEIGQVIVGQHDLVRSVIVCLLCEGHALLEGVPGLGKTQLLKTLSDVVDLEFSRVQFTPDLMPADIVGTQVLEEDDSGRRAFRFRAGPVFANLVLADEINRASPKTQSALLEAMQERAVTVAGETRPLPRPFLVMATQNPLEMEGTYPLPEAQLDRFLLKAIVPFPSADELEAVVDRTTGGAVVTLRRVADAPLLKAMIALTREVPIATHVRRHAIDLVVATHAEREGASELVTRYVRFGASPRAAQGLVLAGKAVALLDGRPNVSIDDIRATAYGVLRHRLVLGYEAAADAVTADQLVRSVLESVPAPTAGLRGERAVSLLEPGLLARLERLQLGTRRRLAGQFTGEHRSTRHGTSLDFEDYREYHPGDDYRRIDYNLYARLDLVLLKLFEAEDDVTLRLLVDTSGSMQGAKLEQAKRLAAALGFVSLVRRDVVTLHTFPSAGAAPRFLGRGAVEPLFRRLGALDADGETDFAVAAAHVLARPGPPGVTIVLSDLLTPDWERGISRLPSRGGDLVVVHVLDREDLEPQVVGDFDLVDRETGDRVAVSLSPASVEAYAKLARSWVAEVAGRCRQAGASYVRVFADEDIEDVLVRGWVEQGVLR